VAIVADTGALIGFERGDRIVTAVLEAALRRGEPVLSSSGCIAQAWRSGGPRQALLARLLKSVDERPLDSDVSRAIGILCAKSGVSDVVDGHVSMLVSAGDLLMTSDVEDLGALLKTSRVDAVIHRC
jgi:hypothetical protein